MCSNAQRILIEKEIAAAVIEDAAAKGFQFRIDYGDGMESTLYETAESCVKAMHASDDERVYLYKPKRGWTGWVYFVYGNSGWDVVCDYTCNLDKLGIMERADKLSQKYQ